jgi:hypothetical protein
MWTRNVKNISCDTFIFVDRNAVHVHVISLYDDWLRIAMEKAIFSKFYQKPTLIASWHQIVAITVLECAGNTILNM